MFKNSPDIIYFAHRGCRTLAPENSMSSFRKARELNVPGIELDVQMCSTGELVIMHDFSTKRTTGQTHKIKNTPYDKIKELECGSHFDKKFLGEKIPQLEELFKEFGNNFFYDIEIKREVGASSKKIVEKVIALIKKYNIEDKCMISSFNPFIVKQAVKQGFPRTSIIFSNDKDVPLFLRKGFGYKISKCNIIKPKVDILESSRINKKLLKKNLLVMTWTVDTEAQHKAALEKNAIGICSNVAEKFIK